MTAHPVPCLRRGTVILFAAASLAGAFPAGALDLGELRVHSALGEPLDATIAVRAAPGEALVAACLSLGPETGGGSPSVSRADFAVETQRGERVVRVRTAAAVDEPALFLRVVAACEGAPATRRDYALLLDPRTGTGLRTAPGDTLASLATAIHPRPPATRDAYLKALRAENPALAGLPADEPIPAGSTVVLPDLRRFSRDLKTSPALGPPVPAMARPKPESVAKREAVAPAASTRPAPAIPAGPPAKAPAKADAPASAAKPAVAPRAPGGFVLRLSSPDVDISRSRGIDEGQRARLRERLLILDADDQVSALLSMRNSLKQLEGRVAELQLKLSTLPSTLPPPAAPPKGPRAPAVSAPAAPAVSAPAAPAGPAPPPAQAPKAMPAPRSEAAARPDPVKPAPVQAKAEVGGGLPAEWWGVLALLAVAIALAVAILVGKTLSSRRRPAASREGSPAGDAARARSPAAIHPGMPDLDLGGPAARPPPAPRLVAETDADLATRVPGVDPQVLRRRYIEQRFPEIAGGTISVEDPDSVVKAARLFYEDGALPHAVELLQYAIEEDPQAMKPWLALFEIFRLEGLAGEFATLAGRFRHHHGSSDYWRKVQYVGRELDAANPLYRDAAFTGLETIGYPSAAKSAAVVFDPLAENWLNAPMDFTTDALAADLRAALMADANLFDGDLIPNPMPALKSVEMFNVA